MKQILILAVLGVAGYFAYKKFKPASLPVTDTSSSLTSGPGMKIMNLV